VTILFNPKTFAGYNFDPATRALFLKTIDWFEQTGMFFKYPFWEPDRSG